MMMSGVLPVGAGWCDTHVLQTEVDGLSRRDDRAILEIGEINLCALGRGGGSARQPFSGRPLRYGHPYARRHDRGHMRNVVLVAEQKLQRMAAGLERDFRFRLP